MRASRCTTVATIATVLLMTGTAAEPAAADVTVNMPPPPPAARMTTLPSAEFEDRPAEPTVGEVALYRYARVRSLPRDTYMDPRYGRYLGGPWYGYGYYPAYYYPAYYYPYVYPFGGWGFWGYPFFPRYSFTVTRFVSDE